MGERPDAWLDLGLADPVDALLTCRVEHAVSPAVLSSLQVALNGVPLELHWRPDGAASVIEASVPALLQYTYADRVRISFMLDEAAWDSALRPADGDGRRLGIALSAISLSPVAAGGRRQ
jgi:hypothetical protein